MKGRARRVALTASRDELLVAHSDQLFRQVIHDALGFSSRLEEIRGWLSESIELSNCSYSLLISIEELGANRGVGVNHLGDHLRASNALVTTNVTKLVKRGLVRKTGHPCDGRRVMLTVTDQARRLLDQLALSEQPINDAIFANLNSEQFRIFADIIATLVRGTEDALALLRRRPGVDSFKVTINGES